MKKLIMSVMLSALLPMVANAELEYAENLIMSGEQVFGYNYNYGLSISKDGIFRLTHVDVVNEHDLKYTIYNDDLSVMKEFTISDAYSFVNGTNEWGEAEEIATRFPIAGNMCERLTMMDYQPDIWCTQHLFNSDDKYEVVIANNERDGFGFDSYFVYNEDGDCLGEIKKNDFGFLTYYYNLFECNGIYYYVTGVSDDTAQNIAFYSFTDGSGIESPKLVRTVSRAYPNPLPSGRSLTIDFATSMASAGYVQVADLSGAVVYRAEVEAGASSVNVPARCLRGGTYVYSVYCNGEVIDSGKILTK